MNYDTITTIGFWLFVLVCFVVVILDAISIKAKKDAAWKQEVMKTVRNSHNLM